MQDSPIDKRSTRITRGFYPVLEYSATNAAERISNHGGGDKMIGVEDQDVVVIIYDAPAAGVEGPNDVNICFDGCRCVIPSSTQVDDSCGLCILDLKQ